MPEDPPGRAAEVQVGAAGDPVPRRQFGQPQVFEVADQPVGQVVVAVVAFAVLGGGQGGVVARHGRQDVGGGKRRRPVGQHLGDPFGIGEVRDPAGAGRDRLGRGEAAGKALEPPDPHVQPVGLRRPGGFGAVPSDLGKAHGILSQLAQVADSCTGRAACTAQKSGGCDKRAAVRPILAGA